MLAIACAILGGIWTTEAEARWHCDEFDHPYRAPEECDLPHDPNGSGYLMAYFWNATLGATGTLAVRNAGPNPVKAETWKFGILRETNNIPAEDGRKIGISLGDRIWGAGTTGRSRVKMFYEFN